MAEASRPWGWSWPSPLALFAPPTLLWDVCDQSTAGRFSHPSRVPTTTAGSRHRPPGRPPARPLARA
ncbi:hypothetical protein AB0D54_25685 [Streptomyces xanthophaeus]|uniref:hypothetical protein n=1 Tax=Streptomyces xanthophaeus TaxID=67385 RepID=UPI00342CB390